jgi:hypothetical protein
MQIIAACQRDSSFLYSLTHDDSQLDRMIWRETNASEMWTKLHRDGGKLWVLMQIVDYANVWV